MNTKWLAIPTCFLIAGLLVSGCGPGQILGPTLTPIPTSTLTPTLTPTPVPTLTSTPIPTITPSPTATPDRLADLDLEKISLQAGDLSTDPVSYEQSIPQYAIFNSAPNPDDLVKSYSVGYGRTWSISGIMDVYDYFDQTIYVFKTEELAHAYFQKEKKSVPSGRGRLFEEIGDETRGFYFGAFGSGVFWRHKETFVLLVYHGTRIGSGEDAPRLAQIIQSRLAENLK